MLLYYNILLLRITRKCIIVAFSPICRESPISLNHGFILPPTVNIKKWLPPMIKCNRYTLFYKNIVNKNIEPQKPNLKNISIPLIVSDWNIFLI